MGEKKTARKNIRLTEEEARLIEERARRLGVSQADLIAETCARSTTEELERKLELHRECAPESSESAPRRARRPTGGEQRTRRLFVRVTPSEDERLRARASAAGVSLSDYVVGCALREDWRPTVVPEGFDARLLDCERELKRQGGNLNQMTRALHSLSALAWLPDAPVGRIDKVLRELDQDNERTRADLNDAIRAAGRLIDEIAASRRAR